MQEAYAEDMSLEDWMRTVNVNLTAVPVDQIRTATHCEKQKGQL